MEAAAAPFGGGEFALLSNAAVPGGGGGICTKLIAENCPLLSIPNGLEGDTTHHVAPIPDELLVGVVPWHLGAEGTGDVEDFAADGLAV